MVAADVGSDIIGQKRPGIAAVVGEARATGAVPAVRDETNETLGAISRNVRDTGRDYDRARRSCRAWLRAFYPEKP